MKSRSFANRRHFCGLDGKHVPCPSFVYSCRCATCNFELSIICNNIKQTFVCVETRYGYGSLTNVKKYVIICEAKRVWRPLPPELLDFSAHSKTDKEECSRFGSALTRFVSKHKGGGSGKPFFKNFDLLWKAFTDLDSSVGGFLLQKPCGGVHGSRFWRSSLPSPIRCDIVLTTKTIGSSEAGMYCTLDGLYLGFTVRWVGARTRCDHVDRYCAASLFPEG